MMHVACIRPRLDVNEVDGRALGGVLLQLLPNESRLMRWANLEEG